MHALRLFIAISIPAFAIEKITEVQDRFKRLDLRATWVKPANIHLTLKFLGETPSRRVPEIKEGMLKAVSPTPRFQVSLGETGVFPNADRPRVLWVAVDDPEGNLESLQKKIEAELSPLGFPAESRKFSSHLTMGRIKSPKGAKRLKKEIDAVGRVAADPFEVSSLKLYQSELTPQGPIYTVLEEFPLAAQGSPAS